MLAGRVDEVDGHFIATDFVAMAFPTRTVYIASKSTHRASVTSSLAPIEVKPDWRSILLGYARLWLPIFGIALPVLDLFVAHRLGLATIATSALALGAAVLAARAGRLPEKEKARLRLLGTVTGLRIDPARLQDTTRATKRDSLGDLMEKGGIPTTPAGILEVIDDIPLPAMPLVYGFCCYVSDAPEWRQCADLIYQRHQSAES